MLPYVHKSPKRREMQRLMKIFNNTSVIVFRDLMWTSQESHSKLQRSSADCELHVDADKF